MLLYKNEIHEISVMTPAGVEFKTPVEDVCREDKAVSCAVRKQSGDDPDVTDGMLIYARVSYEPFDEETPALCDDKTVDDDIENAGRIKVFAGEGIGLVTKPGLSVSPGKAAINPVPLSMIKKAVLSECDECGHEGRLYVMIYAPEGRERAKKTFNERLGIRDGISIIGTSGIVEPMSLRALKDTIALELSQKKALGHKRVLITPGNYGRDFLKEAYGYDQESSVLCSNFIGDTIDMAVDAGFESLLLMGHIGKLVKVSGGIMNTHSAVADCRMELMAASALRAGADNEILRALLDCVSTDAALSILDGAGLIKQTMECMGERIGYHLEKKAGGRIRTEFIVYSNEWGELVKSKGAKEWFTSWEPAAEQRT